MKSTSSGPIAPQSASPPFDPNINHGVAENAGVDSICLTERFVAHRKMGLTHI
jgi:hypothetical protein